MKGLRIVKLLLLSVLPLLNVDAQKGYPERSGIKDLYEKFQSPPEGYGEVPFYWWQADTLTKERLTWQLDELSKKKISSLQINYSHTDNKEGYFWGSSLKSQPAQFTEEWWRLFGWFMQEAGKRNMTVSVSDYTLGIGQGYALDEVRSLHPDIAASQLIFEDFKVTDGRLSVDIKEGLVSVVAFRKDNPDVSIDLTNKVVSSYLDWKSDIKEWRVVVVYSVVQERSYNPMHPLSGKEYVRCFFQRFEDKLPGISQGMLNFFFSDELNFNLQGITWDSRFSDEFLKRKGYDIRPYLAALTTDIGKITVKIRMDYNDVFTSLSEENFFIPVYNWHADRNLIYGCDHGGRGLQVDEFGDYFRTQRWNQGPGSDQPQLSKNIIKAKVASSLAHLYERPRVWLEGFYSSGWGTSSASLMDAIYANYAMGYNLLSLHGLYYATPGSMWEWAPPCNHFRMPYWEAMDKNLEITERLSYLFSQGYHQCDVGILYPVEPKVSGYMNTASNTAFKAGEKLYGNGVDFDYIDYSSLQNAIVDNGELKISGESYKALIIPSMSAIKDASLRKLIEFSQKGGILINIGSLPEATEVHGKDMSYVGGLVSQMSSGKNYYSINEIDSVLYILDSKFSRDFRLCDTNSKFMPYINHRKIDNQEIYGVYNVEKETECFFREKGCVEFWDVNDGKKYRLSDIEETNEGTIVRMPYGKSSFQIIVFTPYSNAPFYNNSKNVNRKVKLGDVWECEMIPVLNNRFGDFHYPGTEEKLSPEIRHYQYLLSEKSNMDIKHINDKEWSEVTYTYGTEFMYSGATDQVLNDAYLAQMKSAPNDWKPYIYSRKWGVYGDAGHQGYHGLKMEMNPEVIRLGKIQNELTETKRVEERAGRNYYLFTTVKAPYTGDYSILVGNVKPLKCFINGNKILSYEKIKLNKGINRVVLYYDSPCITYFFIRDIHKGVNKSSEKLSLCWYNDSSILPFNPYPEAYQYGWYRFESAPGLKGFSVGIHGEPKVWVDGKSVEVKRNGEMLNVSFRKEYSQPADVLIRVKHEYGTKGGSAIMTELKQVTGRGVIATGDWGKMSGLRNYSGGVRYIQKICLDTSKANEKIILKLSDVSSSVKLYVNGKYAGVRVSPDWEFNITDYVINGDNLIEFVVYNTAANHYETIPTFYMEQTPSGILGEVYIEYVD